MTDAYLEKEDLDGFLSDIDDSLHAYLEEQGADEGDRGTGLCGNDILYLVDIGGTGLLHHLDYDERRANDLDFAVIHTHVPNDRNSYREGAAIEDAFADYGFEPTRGNGRYDPTNAAINIFNNEHYNRGDAGEIDPDAPNSLPITKIDVFGGDRPLGSYPIQWVFDNMEPIEIEAVEGRKKPLTHFTTLSLPSITARKVYRSTVDNEGTEDDRQSYDLGSIYDHVRDLAPGKQSWFRSEFKNAWSRLVLANRQSDRMQAFEDRIEQPLDASWGWQYFQTEENRA